MRKVSKSRVHPIPELMVNRPRNNLDRLTDTQFSFVNVLSRSKCLNKIIAIRPSIGGNIMTHLLQTELFKGPIGAMTY